MVTVQPGYLIELMLSTDLFTIWSRNPAIVVGCLNSVDKNTLIQLFCLMAQQSNIVKAWVADFLPHIPSDLQGFFIID